MPRSRRILTINGGSSSIKFAIYESGTPLRKLLHGEIQRIGLPGAALQVNLPQDVHATSQIVAAPDFESAIGVLLESLEQHLGRDKLLAIGHRVVHGGPHFNQATRITTEVIDELRRISPFDPEHLPGELRLIDALRARFPDVPQVACFDTAFFHDLPRVAQLLPIPRRFQAQGIRRYGFHGLSYAYLLERLQNTAGTVVAQGRIIMAHLGNGSSLAAIKEGQPLDTSMGFTPTAGVPMSTRSGDLDPGLVVYLLTSGKLNASQFGEMVNSQSGLLGVSEISSDMRDLLEQEATDERAADAVAMYCYEVKKRIGAYTAVLGGLDTIVFAGGIGENAATVRQRICEGLGFLGVELSHSRNQNGSELISSDRSGVGVRVIATDEESKIAQLVISSLLTAS